MASVPRVIFSVNGIPKICYQDYLMSQDGDTWHFSFLIHSLSLQAGDQIQIQFDAPAPLDLAQADLLGIAYSPFHALRDSFR